MFWCNDVEKVGVVYCFEWIFEGRGIGWVYVVGVVIDVVVWVIVVIVGISVLVDGVVGDFVGWVFFFIELFVGVVLSDGCWIVWIVSDGYFFGCN